jgi:hypothetical protein
VATSSTSLLSGSFSFAPRARHLDHLGDRRIPGDGHGHLIALGAGALDGAADRLAHRLGIDDGLLIDGILGCGFGGISLDPVLAAGHGQLDQLDGRGRYVKSEEGTIFALQQQHFYFLFRTLRLKLTALFKPREHYISAQS